MGNLIKRWVRSIRLKWELKRSNTIVDGRLFEMLLGSVGLDLTPEEIGLETDTTQCKGVEIETIKPMLFELKGKAIKFDPEVIEYRYKNDRL